MGLETRWWVYFDDGTNDVPVIGVHVSTVFPPVSPDTRVNADAGTCQQRDISRGEKRRDAFYRCSG